MLLGWLLLALDRAVLTGVSLGSIAPLVSGLVVVLTVVLVLLSSVVWPLAAHFDDPVGRLLRMGLVLLLRRPTVALLIAVVLAAAIWVAQTVPGLMPVLGIALPAWAVTTLLWRSGAMPLRA